MAIPKIKLKKGDDGLYKIVEKEVESPAEKVSIKRGLSRKRTKRQPPRTPMNQTPKKKVTISITDQEFPFGDVAVNKNKGKYLKELPRIISFPNLTCKEIAVITERRQLISRILTDRLNGQEDSIRRDVINGKTPPCKMAKYLEDEVSRIIGGDESTRSTIAFEKIYLFLKDCQNALYLQLMLGQLKLNEVVRTELKDLLYENDTSGGIRDSRHYLKNSDASYSGNKEIQSPDREINVSQRIVYLNRMVGKYISTNETQADKNIFYRYNQSPLHADLDDYTIAESAIYPDDQLKDINEAIVEGDEQNDCLLQSEVKDSTCGDLDPSSSEIHVPQIEQIENPCSSISHERNTQKSTWNPFVLIEPLPTGELMKSRDEIKCEPHKHVDAVKRPVGRPIGSKTRILSPDDPIRQNLRRGRSQPTELVVYERPRSEKRYLSNLKTLRKVNAEKRARREKEKGHKLVQANHKRVGRPKGSRTRKKTEESPYKLDPRRGRSKLI